MSKSGFHSTGRQASSGEADEVVGGEPKCAGLKCQQGRVGRKRAGVHSPLSLHPSEPESEWNLLMVGAGGVRVADEGRVRVSGRHGDR